MDITTVKLPPLDIIPETQGLELIFDLQTKLLQRYKELEGLPQWPLQLDLKHNQTLVKEFLSRTLEELVEAEENVIMMLRIKINHHPYPGQSDECNLLCKQLNEELADVLHFFIETCIMIGMTPAHFPKLGNLINNAKIYMANNFTINRHVKMVENPNNLHQAGSALATNVMHFLPMIEWEFTRSINRCRGLLKNKAWKQTQVETNKAELYKTMLSTFEWLGVIYAVLGMEPIGIVETYRAKNLVNHERINSKY